MPQQPNSLNFNNGIEDASHVGVGIVFQPTEDGTLYVKRLKEGEPAARSELIQVQTCLSFLLCKRVRLLICSLVCMCNEPHTFPLFYLCSCLNISMSCMIYVTSCSSQATEPMHTLNLHAVRPLDGNVHDFNALPVITKVLSSV
jgi:hypothetical protein